MLAAITLVLVAAPAGTSPLTYLDCTIMQRGAPVEWQITLNEGEGSVDYNTEISGPQRKPARFTADAVYFIGFTLSRIDLTMVRPHSDEPNDAGKCRLAKPKTRAF